MATTEECAASEGVIFLGHTHSVVCFLAQLYKIDKVLCDIIAGLPALDEFLCAYNAPFPEPEPEPPVEPEPTPCPIYCPPPKESIHALIVEVTPAMKTAMEELQAKVCALFDDYNYVVNFVTHDCPVQPEEI